MVYFVNYPLLPLSTEEAQSCVEIGETSKNIECDRTLSTGLRRLAIHADGVKDNIGYFILHSSTGSGFWLSR